MSRISRRLAAALLLAGAVLPACRTTIDEPSVGAVHGRIEGAADLGPGLRVQVYRIDDDGLPTPDPFETVAPDALGRFTTRVLSPGRYRLVYRNLVGPPSLGSVRVPTENSVVLRPLVQAPLVQLRVSSGTEVGAVRCRLTELKPAEAIPDIREFVCSAATPALVRGLRPGRWALDLPDTGDTTEIELPQGAGLRELVVDPPPLQPGAALVGQVSRSDGNPAAWLVVTARPLTESGEAAQRWGRYAFTDRAGLYRITGIPTGTALVRVESREVPARIPPSPQTVSIPPSGTVSMGFVVEP